MVRTVMFAAVIGAAAFCTLAVAEQRNMSTGHEFLASYRKASPPGRQYLEEQALAVSAGIIAADAKIGGGLMCAHGISLAGNVLVGIFQVHVATNPDHGRLPWTEALLEALIAKYPCRR